MAASHSFTVLSPLPDSTRAPSGENATEVTAPECPSKVRSSCARRRVPQLQRLVPAARQHAGAVGRERNRGDSVGRNLRNDLELRLAPCARAPSANSGNAKNAKMSAIRHRNDSGRLDMMNPFIESNSTSGHQSSEIVCFGSFILPGEHGNRYDRTWHTADISRECSISSALGGTPEASGSIACGRTGKSRSVLPSAKCCACAAVFLSRADILIASLLK